MRQQARDIFEAALKAVQPAAILPKLLRREAGGLRICGEFIPVPEGKRLYVVGAGKASAAMAVAAEQLLGSFLTEGVIVTKYGHGLPLQKIRSIEAGHPLPDENGSAGARAMASLLGKAGEGDLVLALISGGASALMADFGAGLTLEAVQELSKALLNRGAAIGELNTVRKHLSFLKGGQLSRAAYPARVVSLIISDVIGDPLHVIASGPTVADPTTFRDALAVLQRYNLAETVSPAIGQRLHAGISGLLPETPKEGDAVFSRTTNHLIATNRMALEAAALRAKALGCRPVILRTDLKGEAGVEAASLIEELYREYREENNLCVLLGGETTVTVRGSGKGGRNQEFALAALCQLERMEREGRTFRPVLLAAGTDGTDGFTEATGAVIDGESISQMRRLGIDGQAYLNNNDSFSCFQQLGGLVITGPTQTNVMDVVIALL